jgi:hypothetical protein
MSAREWLQVPVGIDAGRWTTRSECKTLLVIVHTVTSGQRLLDAVHLVESDIRVQAVFTIAPDVFGNGVEQFLEEIGAICVPWRQACQIEFDLALSASLGGVHEIHAPLVVMPHGAGYNKLATRRSIGRAVARGAPYGLDAQRLVHDGTVVPAALVLPHHAELGRLARTCPEAVPTAVVAGDPSYDRLEASLANQAAYRRSFGVADGQRLIVVTSTWGPRSLLGSRFELLPKLVAELSGPDYRIMALLHPNAWFGHGTWQIRAWLADCLRNGLSLLPPEADWRAALAAADCVIGDHGSVTLYGAVADVPVLLAGFPAGDIDPDSALAELAATAPRATPQGSARETVERAFAEYRPGMHRAAVERITSEPGRFNRNMRQLMYRLMRLPQPSTLPVTRPVAPSFLRAVTPGGSQ